MYIASNHGSGNFVRLSLLDVENGHEEKVESDPMQRVDLSDAQFSDLNDELLLTSYEDDSVERYGTGRNVSVRQGYEEADVRIPHPREIAAREPVEKAADSL